MAEKPIIFRAEMVKAILEGRKTQTRRVIVPQPIWEEHNNPIMVNSCYQVGDKLWVRENICTICYPYHDKKFGYGENLIQYNADELLVSCPPEREEWWKHNWHIRPSTTIPSIHMPKWAARLWLEVIDVRAERLQGITEKDAESEGCFKNKQNRYKGAIKNASGWYDRPTNAFKSLWDSINGKRGYSWETNPFVFVYTFKKVN